MNRKILLNSWMTIFVISGCASVSSLHSGVDPFGNPVCLTDCREILAAIEKFKQTQDLTTEQSEINYLLYRIQSSRCSFDRNGMIYHGMEAAQFLRWKIGWYEDVHDEEINSDEDFVAKVLRGSEKTGQPYAIIMPDGSKYNAQSVMQNELNLLNKFNAQKSTTAYH